VAAGHEVTVVTSPYEKSDTRANRFLDQIEVEGIKVKVINSADSNRYSTPLRVLKAFQFAFFSSIYALTLHYDVIICSSGPITVGVPGLLARWFRRKRFVFEVRDLWPAGGIEMKRITSPWQIRLALWFEKVCYSNACLIVTASPDQKQHILDRFPELSIEVIPNACDNELFGKPQHLSFPTWTNGKKLFSHIGSLGFIHNVSLLIAAAKVLKENRNSDLLLVLIGDGAERKELETKVAEWQLTNVYFLGALPKNQISAWYQKSIATLFTTLNNPVQNSSSPNKVFDSFASGTPVIQTTTGWIKQLLDDERCGLNVPPDDPVALANEMIRLASDEVLRKELALQAKHVALTQFDRTLLADRYLKAIQLH
jgi:glycosyltransferase involved in cell wall biosynthesis